MAIITLTTDFGSKDHSVAVLKGTILSQLPEVNIVDISHEISPFNVQECAYILNNAFSAFPKGSIHIIGLDDEISPENEHIVVLIDGHYFISANNGVISLLCAENLPEKVMEIALPNTEISSFPSLSVFVKVACHLARGGKMEVLAKPFDRLKELKAIEPVISNDEKTMIGNVIYIDNYGNLITNIQKIDFEARRKGRPFEIVARNHKIKSIYNTYNGFINYDLEKSKRNGPGDLLALFNASGYIELAIYKSNLNTVGGASTLLGLNYRDTITINFL